MERILWYFCVFKGIFISTTQLNINQILVAKNVEKINPANYFEQYNVNLSFWQVSSYYNNIQRSGIPIFY